MITLKSFAEEIPVSDLTSVKRFLVFEDDNGRQLRVPTNEDGIRAVAMFMQNAPARTEPAEVEEIPEALSDEPENAQVFGSEEEPSTENELPSYELPQSEDGVPSL